MIARLRPALFSCEGLTALETAVVLFITAIVAVPLLAVAGWVVTLPVEWRANVEAARDAREILRRVADDARQASCIEAGVSSISDTEDNTGTSSEYWRFTWKFTWVDYTDRRSFVVRYSYREDGPVVRREETFIEMGEENRACVDEETFEAPQPSKSTEFSVAYFAINPTPIPDGCLIGANVIPSWPKNAPMQEIAAMMRPDIVECQQPLQ